MWTTPRSWSVNEPVTAYIFNTHLRDELNVLRTMVEIGSGGAWIVLGLKGVGYGGGGAVAGVNANAAGGGDTKLTGYTVSIPANLLVQPGDALIIEGTFVLAANTNSKTAKIKLGSGGPATTFLVNAQNVANHTVPFRLIFHRNSTTSVILWGMCYPGAGPAGAPSTYMLNTGVTVSGLAVANDLDIYLASSGAGDIFLTDYNVWLALSTTGAVV